MRVYLQLMMHCLFFTIALCSQAEAISERHETVVYAITGDTYYNLAEEIAAEENAPFINSLPDLFAAHPKYILWVSSPAALTQDALSAYAVLQMEKGQWPALGIISGETSAAARELYTRGQSRLRNPRDFVNMASIHAENQAMHIPPEILLSQNGDRVSLPLSMEEMRRAIEISDYIMFTGHGGRTNLRLDAENKFTDDRIPSLHGQIIATGSCNTFRISEENSIALGFINRGALSYSGFMLSPNSGYLLGAYKGFPFQYAHPAVPVGIILQIQNKGALLGFAAFPYYFQIGDPRLTLRTASPCALNGDEMTQKIRTLTYSAPRGFIPLKIEKGEPYPCMEIEFSAANAESLYYCEKYPFFNSRIQSINIREDKYILFEHPGEGFRITLHENINPLKIGINAILDSFDYVFIILPDYKGYLMNGGAAVVLAILFFLQWRKKSFKWRGVFPAFLAGSVYALLIILYTLLRLDHVTITSKASEPVMGASLLMGFTLFLGISVYQGSKKRVIKFFSMFLGLIHIVGLMLFWLLVCGGLNILAYSEFAHSYWNYNNPLLIGIAAVVHLAVLPVLLRALPERKLLPKIRKKIKVEFLSLCNHRQR